MSQQPKPAEQWSLEGKHVVITGASSGLGEALALEMAAHGARMTLLARRKDRLDEVARQVHDRGGQAIAIAADVTSRESVEKAIADAVAAFGPVDVLVANSGISRGMSAQDLDVTAAEDTMRVNYLGVVYSAAAVLPSMIQHRSGVVLAISSLAAFRGLPSIGPYCASKAAVSAWMQSLRPELAELGVKLITSHPGYIDTPMTQVNEYEMAYLVTAGEAARVLVRGLLRGDSEINFPRQAVLLSRLAAALPNRLYDRAIWGTSAVSWGTAARDAVLWLAGGAAVCLIAWLSLSLASPTAARTLKLVYQVVLPVLGMAGLIASRWIRGSSKVPVLILILGTPLAAVTAVLMLLLR
jgi:short-subunit dehydrogenase